jgi:signal transduction histidine kinase
VFLLICILQVNSHWQSQWHTWTHVDYQFSARCQSVISIHPEILSAERDLKVRTKSASLDSAELAQAALRESDDRFRQLAEHVRDVCWMWQLAACCTSTTRSKLSSGDPPIRFYDNREEWLEAVHPDDRSSIEALHSSVTDGADGWDVEYRIVQPNGETRWLHERAFPVAAPGGAAFRIAGIAEDITALKKSFQENQHYQTRLQELTRELDQARESERHRIAATLHDDVGQNLAVIRIRLGQLGKELPAEQKEFLNSTAELVQQTIDSTRNLMVELSPAPLYELGFWPAVDRLASQVTAQSGIEVVCEDLCPETKVNLDTATVLFRIVRELLHNCVKHSGTQQAVVRQFVEHDQLVIQVEDNGQGFEPPDNWSQASGLGLLMTHERAQSLGGEMEIDSAPGHGTRISISAPLASCKEPTS